MHIMHICTNIRRASNERLAEYGWQPHPIFFRLKQTHRRPRFIGARVKHRGTVAWNSRVQTVPCQQYSATLSNNIYIYIYTSVCG